MPDISMCLKKDCPKAKECYRFTAIPNEYRQSYMSPEYDQNGCSNFWQVETKKKKPKTKARNK